MGSQAQGLRSEKVALTHFQKIGYRLLRHRLRTPFCEIDLLLRGPHQQLCLVEVKSLRSWDFLSIRVKPAQAKRLLKALKWFCEKEPGAQLMLAVVGPADEVLVFDDVFS